MMAFERAFPPANFTQKARSYLVSGNDQKVGERSLTPTMHLKLMATEEQKGQRRKVDGEQDQLVEKEKVAETGLEPVTTGL